VYTINGDRFFLLTASDGRSLFLIFLLGLFIAFIGLKSMGIVVANQATYVGLGEFTKTTCVSIVGLLIITIMEIKKLCRGVS